MDWVGGLLLFAVLTVIVGQMTINRHLYSLIDELRNRLHKLSNYKEVFELAESAYSLSINAEDRLSMMNEFMKEVFDDVESLKGVMPVHRESLKELKRTVEEHEKNVDVVIGNMEKKVAGSQGIKLRILKLEADSKLMQRSVKMLEDASLMSEEDWDGYHCIDKVD